MNTQTLILVIVLVVAVAAGGFVYLKSQQRPPSAGQQIGSGVGLLVGGILQAAGVQ